MFASRPRLPRGGITVNLERRGCGACGVDVQLVNVCDEDVAHGTSHVSDGNLKRRLETRWDPMGPMVRPWATLTLWDLTNQSNWIPRSMFCAFPASSKCSHEILAPLLLTTLSLTIPLPRPCENRAMSEDKVQWMDQSDPWIRCRVHHGSESCIGCTSQIDGSWIRSMDPWIGFIHQILGSDAWIRSIHQILGSDPRIGSPLPNGSLPMTFPLTDDRESESRAHGPWMAAPSSGRLPEANNFQNLHFT